jgi:NADH dehydrogenase
MAADLSIVTGAYSYSGRYIARRLLDSGAQVATLTGHPDRPDPFGGQVRAMPYRFDDPAALARSLEGAAALYVTYWVRFEHDGMTYARAVHNTRLLFDAARRAGVGRVVYVSITHPSTHSALPYFSGKAALEDHLRATGLSYAIVRPAVLFGATPGEDVLINNIAYLLRHLPVFGVMGGGEYRLQPVHVEDLARIMVEAGQRTDKGTFDAAGPDVLSFSELVHLIHAAVGSQAAIVHVPPELALVAARALGAVLGDVLLTRDEIVGLMAGLLESFEPPRGEISLRAWIREHAGRLGTRYASEVGRHFR